MNYADIAFQRKVNQTGEPLTYQIPENLSVKAGDLVSTTLRNKYITGLVLRTHNNTPNFKTQNILDVISDTPLLSKNQLTLAKWISEHYFCSIDKVLKLLVPKRIFDFKPFKRTPKQNTEQIIRSKKLDLTKDQKTALNKVIDAKTNKFLIQGVTGSGKTEIYLQIAKHYIDQDKQAIILVPEISLTPQLVDYFEKGLGKKAAIINSKISEGQKYQQWFNIKQGKTKLIIGSRSAIFSPISNLGCIIIDEEHETSYKQDNEPRYHTHEVAEKIIELHSDAKLIYGSATPSIETSEKLKDQTIHLKERIGEAVLPEVEIIDLREEFKKQNYSIFSESLTKAITETLAAKKQIILFINRRGSASSVVCRDCGYKSECLDCQTPLTYHARTLQKPQMICHHCGKISDPPSICPSCKGANIRFIGIGTQKIEQALKETFPEAKVLRADKDTTSQKNGFKKIYQTFKKQEANILVGTQMIAKGLHLPNVALVGVIIADIGLNIPDFKTAERNFQLMTQVAGRTGRSKETGKVIIQTYNPDHISLICAKNHNTEQFLEYERKQRSLLKNPPFGSLAKLRVENKTFKNCKAEAEEIENLLWKSARELEKASDLEIHLYPSYIPRYKSKYRYIILIKDKSNTSLPYDLIAKLPKKYIMNPEIKIDVSPISIT